MREKCEVVGDLEVSKLATELHTVAANARYSASVEDRETVGCFLDFQEINELPKNTQNLVIDRLVSGQVAQSESLNALSCRGESLGK